MTQSTGKNGIYLVYDGECPMCTRAALALRIKEDCGALHLIEARQNLEHPLVKQITELELDLDEGMVLYDGRQFYHGKDAFRLMARYGKAGGLFNSTIKSLYWLDFVARVTYPFLRATRNWLLIRKSARQIDNLKLTNSPTFKPVFGESWADLPPVMHKHYAIHPYSGQSSRVQGKLDVMCAGPVKWLAPLFWMTRGIPPQNEQAVAVTVEFKSDSYSKAFHFDRQFHFKNRKPYCFRSRMIQARASEVIEIMASGFGWRMEVVWEDNRVKLKHKGYVYHFLGCFIPLPVTSLLGRGYAEETAIDDYNFQMFMEITHPLWGKIYGYSGRFKIMDDA